LVPKVKHGFTLIEMMVVLGIISILSLISVGALLANSNYQRLNQSVEQIVSLVRTAQNRSEAITMDPNLPSGSTTKAWEFKMDSTGNYSIVPLNSDGSVLNEQQSTIIPDQDKGSLPAGSNPPVVTIGGNSANNTFSAVFTSPFARDYLATTFDFTRTQQSGCAWIDGSADATKRPANDWYFDPSCSSQTTYSPSNPGSVTILLTYKSNTVTITVNSNGDISYQ